MTNWPGIPISEQLFLFSPMLALTATMLAIVTVPLIAGRGARTIAGTGAIGVVVALVLAVRVLGAVSPAGLSGLSTSPAAGLLVVDQVSVVFQIVLLLFLAAVMYLWWIGSAQTERNAPEFFVLLLGSALGMALMVSSLNLLSIVIAIELASLPSYALVGFDKRDRVGAEASLKYMIFGAVCAAIMLYGASLLYGLVGSLSAWEVARYCVAQFAETPPLVLIVGLVCFLAGVAFKISAVPFHFWCPDAFEGAKIEVTTWLSVVSKAAGLLLLARLVGAISAAVVSPPAMSIVDPLAWTVGVMAIATCTIGNFAAFRQTSVKRLLAYSSIAHAGYMMMAAALFVHPQAQGYESPLTALLIYIVIYMFMNLGAFGVTALVSWEAGNDHISTFTGLMRRSPALAIPMVICLMSLVGLPPFAGFLGKWWVMVALGSSNTALGWVLVTAAAINTLISLYYYVRLIVEMTLRDNLAPAFTPRLGGVGLVNVSASLLLILFILAQPLKAVADRYSSVIVAASALDEESASAVEAVSKGSY